MVNIIILIPRCRVITRSKLSNKRVLDGITWAYVIGVIAVAFTGKIVGGTLAARACKMVWRESFTIGTMMSCKGLIELIVLVSSSC